MTQSKPMLSSLVFRQRQAGESGSFLTRYLAQVGLVGRYSRLLYDRLKLQTSTIVPLLSNNSNTQVDLSQPDFLI